jgi:hypothetical protein
LKNNGHPARFTEEDFPMSALSCEKHIQSALAALSEKRMPPDLPYGSVRITRQRAQTVVVFVEMTFRIRPNRIDWFNHLADQLHFDGAITVERDKNPVLVRVEAPLHKAEIQRLSQCIWQEL